MLEELYWTLYYIWINPTGWSMFVILVTCGAIGYFLDVVTNGWLYLIGLCLFIVFIAGALVVSGINVVQMICGISPQFLSEFGNIAQVSWFDNIVWGIFGLGVGVGANHLIPPTV